MVLTQKESCVIQEGDLSPLSAQQLTYLSHLCKPVNKTRVKGRNFPVREFASMLVLAVVILLCGYRLTRITFSKSRVENLADAKAFTARHLPGFIAQDFHSPRMRALRILIAPVIRTSKTSLEKAIALRKWARNLQNNDPVVWSAPFTDDTEDPYRLLAEQKAGFHGACRRFSYILTSALLASGIEARLVHVAENFQDGGVNHTLVEAWIDSLGKWVLLDATFDTLLLIDHVPASAMDMIRAVEAHAANHVSFERNGSDSFPSPSWNTYQGMFHHLFVAKTNAFFEGYRLSPLASKPIRFLHFVDRYVAPYPQWQKDVMIAVASLCAVTEIFLAWRVFLRFVLRHTAPA